MKVVINNQNEVVKIGDWDFGKMIIDGNEIVTNPLPDGYAVAERDMYFDEVTRSWMEFGKATDKERIKQLEDMTITLLEVF